MDSYQREIRDFLRSWGATDVRIEHTGGKHPKLCYDWRGKPQQPYIVAASSSDRLGSVNAIADLKRRHPDGPVKPVARPRRKLSDMVPAVPFNPIPLDPRIVVGAEVPMLDQHQAGPDMREFADLPSESAAALVLDLLSPVDRTFLKRLVDEMNRVIDETDWRFAKHPKTGRWRVFTVVE